MDPKLSSTIEKIAALCQQNPEFEQTLKSKLGALSLGNGQDNRIDSIYEYCIEKVIRKQAEEFYSDFPISAIVPVLVEDYIRMESFRRKNNFWDFSLALYQQLECMTNFLCEDKILTEITEKMWNCQAYVKTYDSVKKQSIVPDIAVRSEGESYNIASLVFPGQNKKTSLPYSFEKAQNSLQTQYAYDKMRIVVYFVGYKAMMKPGDFDNYREYTSILYDIYHCRNNNHRGNTLTETEQAVYSRINPLTSFYFFKFMGALAQYVDFVKNGFPDLHIIHEYAMTQTGKVSLSGPKVLGKIELPNDNHKRFR